MTIKQLLILIFLFVTTEIFAESGENQDVLNWRATHIEDLNYRVRLNLEKDSEFFAGQVEIDFNLKDTASNPSPLVLDFVQGLISLMILNGKELPISSHYDGQRILLPANLLVQGNNQIVVHFQHAFVEESGLIRWVDSVDKRVYIYSSGEPYALQNIIPVFLQADLLGKFAVSIITPLEWIASCIESRANTFTSKTSRTWEFQPILPLNPFEFRLVVGDLAALQADAMKTNARLLIPKSMMQTDSGQIWRKLIERFAVINKENRTNKLSNQWDFFPLRYFVGKASSTNTGPEPLRDWLWSRGNDTRFQVLALQDLQWSNFAANRAFYDIGEILLWRGWFEYLAYKNLAESNIGDDLFWFTFFTDIKVPLVYRTFEPYIGRSLSSNSANRHSRKHDSDQHIAALLFREWVASEGFAAVSQKMYQLETRLPDPGMRVGKNLPPSFIFQSGDNFNVPKINIVPRCENGIWKNTDVSLVDGTIFSNQVTSKIPFTIYSFAAMRGLQADGSGVVNTPTLQVELGKSENIACPYLILLDDRDNFIVNGPIQGEQIKRALTLLQKTLSPLQQSLIVRRLFEQFADGQWSALSFFKDLLPFMQSNISRDAALALIDWLEPLVGGPNYLQFIPENPPQLAETFRGLYEQWEQAILEHALKSEDPRYTLAWLRAASIFIRSDRGINILKQSLQRPPPTWATLFRTIPNTNIKKELKYRTLSGANVLPASLGDHSSSKRPITDLNLIAADPDAKSYFFGLLINRSNELSDPEKLRIINHLFPDTQWHLHKQFVDQFYNSLPRLVEVYNPDVLIAFVEKLTPVFCTEADENRLSKFMQRNKKLEYRVFSTLERLFLKNRQCIKVKKVLQKHVEKFPLEQNN